MTDISNEAYREARLEEATEIEKIQASTEKQDEKRENIRDCINATLATVGMGGVLGAFGGEVVSLLSNTPSEGPIAIGAGALAAAALAASGVATYHELTNTPKAIEKAKELGVYDLLLERARADRKLDAFHDKIDEEYGIEEKLNEEIERGELEVPGHGL